MNFEPSHNKVGIIRGSAMGQDTAAMRPRETLTGSTAVPRPDNLNDHCRQITVGFEQILKELEVLESVLNPVLGAPVPSPDISEPDGPTELVRFLSSTDRRLYYILQRLVTLRERVYL